MTQRPTFAVVVPTWRRPESLRVCLSALARQELSPARVVVAFKAGDELTAGLLREMGAGLPFRLDAVTVPADGNVIRQQNAGVAATSEDVVALTDDDAEPWPDWLARLATHYADPRVAGVGGRDWQPHERGDRRKVGKISWFGRLVGNHHLGAGPAREVDVLKGVNWSFRGDLLRARGFDTRMRGSGTVMNFEIALSLSLRRAGWKLIYEPAAAVEHHVVVRQDGDVNTRGGFEPQSYINAIHNETVAVWDYLPPWRRGVYLVWAMLIGTSGAPGLAQVPRLVLQRKQFVARRWLAVCRGRWAGLKTALSSQATDQDTSGRAGDGERGPAPTPESA